MACCVASNPFGVDSPLDQDVAYLVRMCQQEECVVAHRLEDHVADARHLDGFQNVDGFRDDSSMHGRLLDDVGEHWSRAEAGDTYVPRTQFNARASDTATSALLVARYGSISEVYWDIPCSPCSPSDRCLGRGAPPSLLRTMDSKLMWTSRSHRSIVETVTGAQTHPTDAVPMAEALAATRAIRVIRFRSFRTPTC